MKKLFVAIALFSFVAVNAQNTSTQTTSTDKKETKTEAKSCEKKGSCCKKGMVKECSDKKAEVKADKKA